MNTKRMRDRVIHGIAGIGPLLFFAVASVEGFLRTDYRAMAQPISALALGPRGWIQGLNFVLLAVSFLAFTAVLRAQLRGGAASIAAPGVLVLMTTGVALSGAFPMDAPGAPHTLAGQLHLIGGFLVFPWMPVVLLLVARRFRGDTRWRSYFAYTLVTGLLSLATLVFFLLFVGPPSFPRPYPGLVGLVQRLQLVPFFVWLALVSHRAYRRADLSETQFGFILRRVG